MNHVLEYLISGMTIGITMALLPSPLLALLVNETLKYGKKEGIIISVIPLITDLPLVTISVFIVAQASKLNLLFGIISFFGFLFLGYLGVKGFFTKGISPNAKLAKPESLKKGIIINILNPNAYIFWFTAGASFIVGAWKVEPVYAVIYIIPFYTFLIGCRMLITIIIEKFKTILNSRGYIILSRILSGALLVFAVKLLLQGISILRK